MPPSAPSYSGVRRSKRICARKKLPISKSFEEDDEAGKLDKAEEIVGVVLPANEDPGAAIESRRRSARRASGACSGLTFADLAWAACFGCPDAARSSDAVLSQIRIH